MISQQNKGRIILIGIASMFFLPILLSWYLNFYTDFKKNAEGVQHGILVDPPIELGEIYGYAIGQKEIQELQQKWTLVFFVGDSCDDICQAKLYQLRQIRLAVGKDRDKVDRLLISKKVVDWDAYKKDYLDQKVVDTRSDSYQTLMNLFSGYKAFTMDAIYLVDAYGSLIMQYPKDTEPKGIIKDIERLIRVAP